MGVLSLLANLLGVYLGVLSTANLLTFRCRAVLDSGAGLTREILDTDLIDKMDNKCPFSGTLTDRKEKLVHTRGEGL